MNYAKILAFGLVTSMIVPFATPEVSASDPYLFSHAVTSENWSYGSGADYWNLKPVNPKDTFAPGQTVYLMVQVTNITVAHNYKAELYRGQTKLWEYETPQFSVGSGWAFGNFYPYYDNAQPGSYTFKAFINTGNGYVQLASNPFTVTGNLPDYVYDHTYLASGWEYGTSTEYWNLKPLSQRTAYNPGETVYALAQVRNILVKHRWKSELYRQTTLLWSDESAWHDVGGGWVYGNYYPYYANAQSGDYKFNIYLDTGTGYQLLDTKSFTVSGPTTNFSYQGATTTSSWKYGEGLNYWNLQPADPKTVFQAGETVYALAQVRNIYVTHRWQAELDRDGQKLWDFQTDWMNVGGGWMFGNFYPSYSNAQAGNYAFKIFLDTGNGFTLMDTKTFTVNSK